MVEGTEEGPPQSGGENPGADADVTSTGNEGRRAAQSSPPIADDAKQEQTETPTPSGDVGVPPDEDMNRPEA